ncbi:MAG: iron ABC transporter permease [Candidatus Schekmanbacteria bacterium]|nr:MAG: iron ABC transporter permease [Candidatus Schekmanbacteria bacterium]
MKEVTPFKIFFVIVVCFIISLSTILFSISVGSVDLPFIHIVKLFFGEDIVKKPYENVIIYELRFPRAIFAFLVGAALSIAGIIFQVVLKNPLAEPYILGVSGGAATGAVIAIFAGIGASYLITLFSFAGAIVSIAVLIFISSGRWGLSPSSLILGGVIINAFFSAVVMFVISISTGGEMRRAYFWLMGNLGNASYDTIKIALPVVLLGGILTFAASRKLNLIALGDETALQLGVNVGVYTKVIIVLASFLTAGVVAWSGLIGFVGLVVPHMVRLIVGADHRITVPVSFFAGGVFLLISDTLARTLLSPIELPVGTVTAIIGAPFFLYLLKKESGKVI